MCNSTQISQTTPVTVRHVIQVKIIPLYAHNSANFIWCLKILFFS